MDRYRQMETFVAVVDHGNFSDAARRLNLTPSAVSKQVGRLEERLEVRLLQRTSRHIELTDEGQLYAERCRTILADVESLEQDLAARQSTVRGRVRLSISSGLARHSVMPTLPALMARYPELDLELHLSDRYVDLVKERIDLALRAGPLGDSSLVGRRLAHQVRVICAAPAYLERAGTPQVPEELLRHECLTTSMTPHINRWGFTGPNGDYTLEVKGRLICNSFDALHDAAVIGMGIVRLSNFVAALGVAEGRLVPILLDHIQRVTTPFSVVYPTRQVTPAMRAVIDHLTEHFRNLPDLFDQPSDEPVGLLSSRDRPL